MQFEGAAGRRHGNYSGGPPAAGAVTSPVSCHGNTVCLSRRISGGELFERIIDEDFELTEREVIKYMLQIIDGVNFIHKQGIVHLDLKPENIMCVNKMGSKIKLIDFGLARRLGNHR